MTTIERGEKSTVNMCTGYDYFFQMKNLLNYSMIGIRTVKTAEQCF